MRSNPTQSNDRVMDYGRIITRTISPMTKCQGYACDAMTWNGNWLDLKTRDDIVIESGAVDYTGIKHEDFVTHKATTASYVLGANDKKVPCLGVGTVRFYALGKLIEITNVLHVPALCQSRYSSVRQHRRYDHCGFIANNSRCFLTFPDFNLESDGCQDCVLPISSAKEARLLTPNFSRPGLRACAVSICGQRKAGAKARQCKQKHAEESKAKRTAEDATLKNVQTFIDSLEAKSKLTPEQLQSLTKAAIANVQVAGHVTDDTLDKLPEEHILPKPPEPAHTVKPWVRPCNKVLSHFTKLLHLSTFQLHRYFGSRNFKKLDKV